MTLLLCGAAGCGRAVSVRLSDELVLCARHALIVASMSPARYLGGIEPEKVASEMRKLRRAS